MHTPRILLPVCLGAAFLGLAIFWGLPNSYYRMVGWPWVGSWQLAFGLVAVGLMVRLRRFQEGILPLGHGLDGLVALTGIILVTTAVTALFKPPALFSSLQVTGYGLLLYGGRNGLGMSEASRQKLWGVLVSLGSLSAIVSLGFWRPSDQLWRAADFLSAVRNAQPLGHHNFVGGYFTLILPLAVAWMLHRQGWRRGLGVVGAGLIALALYASGSRGAALGATLWAIASLATKVFRSHGRQRLRWFAVTSLVVLMLLGVLASNPRMRSLITGIRLERQPGTVVVADTPTLDRWFMLQIAGNILRDRPLVGVGPGNMGRVSNLYRPIETGTGLDHIQQLHSLPVQLMGELGLLGGLLYGAWALGLGRLGWKLGRSPLDLSDQELLYGLGGSFFAYAVSSLSDYQLENIPIAATLSLEMLLAISLADDYCGSPPSLAVGARRLFSLGLLGLLGLMVYAWLPFDLALALGQSGQAAEQQNQLLAAEHRWLKATAITPWDPTFGALASERLLEVGVVTEDHASLQTLILDYAQAAQAAAPNDVWFNQNLAVLLRPSAPKAALSYAARAAQLLPRNDNYTYYLLGQLFLDLNQAQRATDAFILEALAQPEILTYPIWSVVPNSVQEAVLTGTLEQYDALLAATPATARGASAVLTARAVLGWWFDRPYSLKGVTSPVVRALLLAEADPNGALVIVEKALREAQAEAPTASLQLLAARLAPDRYLDAYLATLDDKAERELMGQQILQQPTLRDWLRSLMNPPNQLVRGALAFAYRNQSANQIRLMLRPAGLQEHTLVRELGLFQPWPREFPTLDRHIEALRTRQLGLPHPTYSALRLSPLLETAP